MSHDANIDPKMKEAIEAAVKSAGQSPALARKLIAWLEAMTSGNEDINDRDAVDRRLEVLFAETALATQVEEDEF